tara:strand:+ start:15 stop:530 length:516 start_codon:yes stop_codon:yes gene_type:complete
MYPHQVLMEEQNLQKEALSKEAQNYLKDFNYFHRGVSLKQSRAEKKGKDIEVSEADTQKLHRLSKSVCVQIYEDMNTTRQEAESKRKQEDKLKEEALELKIIQEEEDLRLKEELEQKKKQVEEEEEEEKIRMEEKEKEERQEQERQEKERVKAESPPEVKEEGGSLFDYFF